MGPLYRVTTTGGRTTVGEVTVNNRLGIALDGSDGYSYWTAREHLATVEVQDGEGWRPLEALPMLALPDTRSDARKARTAALTAVIVDRDRAILDALAETDTDR